MLDRPVAPYATIPDDLDISTPLLDERRLALLPDPPPATRAALDHLAALAAEALDGDEAYASVVGANRQVAIGRFGDSTEWPVNVGFCAYTIALGEPLLLGDLFEDPVAAENPLVSLGVRAYAGTVLRLDGERVGALCVLSRRPRAWTIGDAERLTQLASVAEYLLASG